MIVKLDHETPGTVGVKIPKIFELPPPSNILLMVQKSGVHQLRLVVYSISYKVLYIPGGCLGFLPSTVAPEN